MTIPINLRYSTDHEWVSASEGAATVGITAFAAEALGDLVYVQLPEIGAVVEAGQPCGEVESTKSVSELYAPATGTVLEVNDAVVADPSLINRDPYAEGWLYRLQVQQPAALLSAEEYYALIHSA
jgi:glycine cleavage system H protein